MNFLLVHSFTWVDLAVTGLIAFILGFIIRSAMIYKQRKRILQLEDEMLANHSSILTLEKELTEIRNTNSNKEYERSARKDQLRAS